MREQIRLIARTKAVADISEDIAQVCFASLFIGAFLENGLSWIMLANGLFSSIFFWATSIIINRKLQ